MAEPQFEVPEYEPPALVDLGTAEELTGNGSFSSPDGHVEGSLL